MTQHRPGPQAQEWLNDPYTRHLHKQAVEARAGALSWLFGACAKSDDPAVREKYAIYQGHNQMVDLLEYKEIAKEKP